MKYQEGDLWTQDREIIAEHRNVKKDTIDRYMKDPYGKGKSLKFVTDEEGVIWFYIGDQAAFSKASANRIKEAKNEIKSGIKKEQLLTIPKFVTMFHKETGLKRQKIMDMIEDKTIESKVVGDLRMIPFYDKTLTLNQIQKNKKKNGDKVIEELKEEEENNPPKYHDDPQVGLPVPPATWVKYSEKVPYQRLLKALKEGAFHDIEDLYSEDFGETMSSWEIEYPGRELANGIGNLIMTGGRNPTRLRLSIINYLARQNYKSGMGKQSIPENDVPKSEPIEPEEPTEPMVTKKEFDKFKKMAKEKYEELETKTKKIYGMVKQMQDTVRHLNSNSKSSGSGWDDFA